MEALALGSAVQIMRSPEPNSRCNYPHVIVMTSNQVDILDCKVEVRKYVLVSQPSRWRQKGERVVVHSPMLKMPKTVLDVPVKRFNGEEDNSACFIPKQDIEKDTSSIYDKAKVSTTTSWVDAHGVALCASSPDNQFGYERGHKFWICIGANTNGYDEVVPVINLQTCEKGDISLDHVCWFPKIQGANVSVHCSSRRIYADPVQGELWTLGGGPRLLRLSGTKNYSYLSWAICQHLDGSPATTKNVRLPAKDVKTEDIRQLSLSESRSLFKKRLRYMLGETADETSRTNQSEIHSCSPLDYISRTQSSALPTPPASPDQPLLQPQHLQQLQQHPHPQKRVT